MTREEAFQVCGFHLAPGVFSSCLLLTLSNGGELFILKEPVFYLAQDGRLFQIPEGAQSDGISAPKFAGAFGRGRGGDDWVAGWFHDAAYRDLLLVWSGTEWKKATLTKAVADDFLRECALACGDSPAQAEILYQAVDKFGGPAFRGAR